MDIYRGQRIGKYEVLTQLSLGGMAELFLAFTAGPGGFRKFVVVKRILPDVKADEQFVKMFLDEARITAAFSHPNIAQVFDLDEDEEGLYLAMEFISGQNLNQVASACNRTKRTIPMGFSVTVARDVLNALHYAHTFTDPTGKALPVVHRDVAQKNVMVTYDGVTKLLDFGIAKARGRLGRTAMGMVKGTTGYMSPEQVRGEELDGRSDVFSVGVVLHEMLSGQRLFAAQTEPEEMRLILEGPIPKLHDLNELVSEELSAVVARALSRERSDRFGTAREMARALEKVAGPLLYDQEQLALQMRELFEKKVAATRALLESAGDQAADPSKLAKLALGQLKGDAGMDFEEITARGAPKKKPGVVPPQPPPIPLVGGKAPVRDTVAVAPPSAVIARTEKRLAELRGNLVVAAVVLVIVVGGGFGAWKLVHALPPSAGDGAQSAQAQPRPIPVYNDPRIKPFPEPVRTPLPPQQSEHVTPESLALAQVAAEEGRAAPQAAGGTRKATAGGTLTLITVPEATVLRGAKEVGKTPLFNAALPQGTHLLRLKGADGTVRLLSAPIRAGENTAFRVELADLPTE